MQMSEKLTQLKSLQDVLAEKYQLESKVEELPKSLEGSAEYLEQAKKDYILINSQYEEEKEKVSALRFELDEQERLRESGEKGMDNVSTHRDYELLEKQIEEAAQKGKEIREQLVIEEKKLEEMNENLKVQESTIAFTEDEAKKNQAELSQQIEQLNVRINELSEQEKQFTEGLDAETVIKFQRIIKRNREGIVAVKGNVCEGCHMILPAQFANEVRKGKDILFCPYCSRILYYPETGEEEEQIFTLDSGNFGELDDDIVSADEFDFDDEDQNEMENDESMDSSLDY